MTMSTSYPPRFANADDLLATFVPVVPAAEFDRVAGSYSGARLVRLGPVAVDGAAEPKPTILKQMDFDTNWQMRATHDLHCREVQLTQSPLWSKLPETIWSPVLACAQTERSGALLMDDLEEAIFPAERCYGPAEADTTAWIIDRFAQLHAACWQAPELEEGWLVDPADALLYLTPERLNDLQETDDTYASQATRMWPYLWQFLDGPEVTAIWRTMKTPDAYLAALRQAPATLAHGDTWLANLGVRDERLIMLDWALATAGPATFDSLWLAFTWQATDPQHALDQHRRSLVNHGVTAAEDDELWSLLCDLGWVRTFFTGAEWLVRDIRGAVDDNAEREARARLAHWAARTVEILQKRRW